MKSSSTEVDAYIYIKSELKKLGWDARNPSRTATGQVYTQNECFSHPELKKFLGRDTPENIVKINESNFWVIEAKRSRNELKKAAKEAQEYADEINESSQIKAIIVSGVAGNDADGYLISNLFLENKRFKPITINERNTTGLLTPELVKILLKSKKAGINDVPINENQFFQAANRINKALHIGKINKNLRAKVIAALLLSLVDETQPDTNKSLRVLINDINTRVEEVLLRNNKGEFASRVKIELPTSMDNHVKYKRALVSTIQELNSLNITSAMMSGNDILGKFYETFLKYGNGAKEIGIILTPRHITKYAADVLDITHNDVLLDPTCGTGGFLVAAFDKVRLNSNSKQLEKFKKFSIFGIETESEVTALAIVNMIFRGDGKNNIIEGNCFIKWLAKENNHIDYQNDKPENYSPPVTKILMNPPFALDEDDEKEYRFVQKALEQLEDGGLLFSILPMSTMVERNALEWRQSLIADNSLLAVVTFPEDLFYPVSQNTVGIFVKKGASHKENSNVLWCRAMKDGYVKKKKKRLYDSTSQDYLSWIKNSLQSFVFNQNLTITSIPQIMQLCPIDKADDELQLVPEAYIEDKEYSQDEIINAMDELYKENLAFKVRFGKKYVD